MTDYETFELCDGQRVRWIYDEDYETRGSYAYDTEEETRAAEDEELEGLASGELVALGCVVEKRCPTCSQWDETTSCWGYVIRHGEDLKALARELIQNEQA